MPERLAIPQIIGVAAMMGACGGITLILMAIEFGPLAICPWWFVPSAVGAGLGGASVSPIFGHQGFKGCLGAIIGMCLATLTGSFLAILFLGFFEVAMFAPFFVLAVIFSDVVILTVWLGFMIAIQLMVRRWRMAGRLF